MRIPDLYSHSRNLDKAFKELEGCDENIELKGINFEFRCLVGPGSPYQGAMMDDLEESKVLAADILNSIFKDYYENCEDFKGILKVVEHYSSSDIDDIAFIKPDYLTHSSHLTDYYINNPNDNVAARLLGLHLAPFYMIPLDTNLEIFYKEGGIAFNVHIPDNGFCVDRCSKEEIAQIRQIEKEKNPNISNKQINDMIDHIYFPYHIFGSIDIKLDPSKIRAYKFIDSNSDESQEDHQADNILKIKIVK